MSSHCLRIADVHSLQWHLHIINNSTFTHSSYMTQKTSCFTTHIKSMQYEDNFSPWQKKIFDYEITHHSLSLKPDHINHIQVYSESFNSPHCEHFELFHHEFMQSDHDMNIVAVIILLLNDKSLVKKLRR